MLKEEKGLLALVYKDLLRPSAQVIGGSLKAVLEFASTPFMALQLQNDKLKLNLKKRLDEYAQKLEAIPEDKRCEVHPQIGLPIIEKLTYTTCDEIADLFTSLLASASSIDTANTAHPAFISMIERMSPDEARILEYLKDKEDIQYCDINVYSNQNSGYDTLFEHVTMIEEDVALIYPENTNAYLANLVSLGILCDKKGTFRMDKNQYNRIKGKYQVEELTASLVPESFKSIKVEESYYQVTPFGRLFIQACIK
ncbi:DUF4393 domain-containing protein [uncultured Porphyromonas sp.]|jgi:hypothetical protein|uniref:DUF4393 domain-containing protein n=1 Tax=uncultured Porphyromonas sp. TaxID=159274 RepID=UPI0026347E23|nr:DUF4393 domain-containing protein [uncultured Porphyromonas sp.]